MISNKEQQLCLQWCRLLLQQKHPNYLALKMKRPSINCLDYRNTVNRGKTYSPFALCNILFISVAYIRRKSKISRLHIVHYEQTPVGKKELEFHSSKCIV